MIEKLHYITQSHIKGFSHSQLAEIACTNGVKWVQLRIKDISFEDYLREAYQTRLVCEKYGAKLIINDNVTVAKEVKADGVHLGKEDMDPGKARDILGDDFIIGATSNTLEDILKLSRKPIDYIGLGPYRFTTTKKKLSPVLGLSGYEHIVKEAREAGVNLPIIAIGGIQCEDIKEILKTGVHGIAMASVINKAKDKASVIQKILNDMKYGEVAHSRQDI